MIPYKGLSIRFSECTPLVGKMKPKDFYTSLNFEILQPYVSLQTFEVFKIYMVCCSAYIEKLEDLKTTTAESDSIYYVLLSLNFLCGRLIKRDIPYCNVSCVFYADGQYIIEDIK